MRTFLRRRYFGTCLLLGMLSTTSEAIAAELIELSELTVASPAVVDSGSSIPDNRLSQSLEGSLLKDNDPGISMSDLTDVKPTDWAFQALKALVERYGILDGYLDSTFRGDRVLTRYEFATAVNEAASQIELLGYATKEDLELLQRLLNDFQGRIDEVEKEVDRLERSMNQFSATTKLNGEVVFGLTGIGIGKRSSLMDDPDREVTFGSRVSLELSTSLTGRDLLRTTLKTGNISPLNEASGTDMADLSFQGDKRNIFELDELVYRRRFGKKLRVNAVALGGGLSKFAETFNPFAESGSSGVISRFGQRNPIFRQGGGAGLGFSYDVNKSLTLSAGYLADDAEKTREGGLFGGSNAAIAQLTFDLSKTAGFGITYVRSYNSLDTGTGSERANDPFRRRSGAITSNSFGIQGVVGLTPKIALSGWAGFTRAQAQDLPDKPTANIFNWALMLAFPDLLKEGNLGGIVIGQPPKVTRNDFLFRRESYRDIDTTLHLEAFYRYRVNDSISITPGLLVLVHPEHNRDNGVIYVGTLRTSFSF